MIKSLGGIAIVGCLVITAGVIVTSSGTGTVPSGGVPGILLKGMIPAQYEDLVTEAGQTCPEITPAILAATLQQESGFNPEAQSKDPKTNKPIASGIAQFVPGTWAAWGIDANKDGKTDVWDPEDAIPSSAAYLCHNVEQVKDVPGDPVANALAAYNAGPGAVKQAGGIPAFRETQNYVKTITASAKTFAVKTTGGTPQGQDPLAQAAAAVNAAQEHLGKPYVWGGDGNDNSAGGFDCSGLTKAAYAKAGVELPRVANDQYAASDIHPKKDELLPGDLVFFATDPSDYRSIHHVGIYVGGGYMLHAPRTGSNIKFAPTTVMPDYFGATRPTTSEGTRTA